MNSGIESLKEPEKPDNDEEFKVGVNLKSESNEVENSTSSQTRYKDLSKLTDKQIARLIYKTFKLQFENRYSESSDSDHMEEEAKLKHKKALYERFKRDPKNRKSNIKTSVQSNSHVGSGYNSWNSRYRSITEPNQSDEDSYFQSVTETVDSASPEGAGYFTANEEADDAISSSHSLVNLETSSSTEFDASMDSSLSVPLTSDHAYASMGMGENFDVESDNIAFQTDDLNYNFDDEFNDTPQTNENDNHDLLVSLKNTSTLDDSVTPVTEKSTSITSQQLTSNTPASSINSKPGCSKSDDSIQTPKTKNEWECPICFDTSLGQDIATTVCGHVFCKACIESFLITNNKCPTCRKRLTRTSVITLYNFR